MKSQESYEIKVVLVGSINVGKTAIVSRFVHSTFNPRGMTTIGASFMTKTLNIDGFNVRFQVWDTAGAEKYHALTPMYYRCAQISILVYDVTVQTSLEEAKNWAHELRNNGADNSIVYLVGNKIDLKDNQVISEKDGLACAEKMDAKHWRTSAKDGTGVVELFKDIAFRMYGREIERERLIREGQMESDSSSEDQMLEVRRQMNASPSDVISDKNGENKHADGSTKSKGGNCC